MRYEFLSHDRWVRQRIPINLVYFFLAVGVSRGLHESHESMHEVVLRSPIQVLNNGIV